MIAYLQGLKPAVAPALIAILGGTMAIALQLPQLRQLQTQPTRLTPEAVNREVEQEETKLNLLKISPSFGFNNVIADWTLINFLIYFGDDPARQLSGYNLVPDYFENIVSRDPRFIKAYLFASVSLSLYAGTPERSVALMNQGLQSLSPSDPPQSYYVWRYRGIDEFLFLNDTPSARKAFTTAADWASVYPDAESQFIAATSRQTANFLEQNPDSKTARISVWTMVLSNTIDDRARQRAIQEILKLGGQVQQFPDGRYQVTPPLE